MSANEQAGQLLECTTNELIGKKLLSILKKTSQVLEEALEEDFPMMDGAVVSVSGKVVNTCELILTKPFSLLKCFFGCLTCHLFRRWML